MHASGSTIKDRIAAKRIEYLKLANEKGPGEVDRRGLAASFLA
jgi:anti-sigma28 factor (negative regulator of flagellin synthesis)